MPKEIYIPPEKRQQIIDELSLLQLQIYCNNGEPEDHKFVRQKL